MGLSGIGMLFEAIGHKLGQSVFMLIGALIISIGLLMWTTSVFIVPMVAIWCSEMNADQAPAGRSQEETLNALRTLPEETAGRQWLLFRLAHPPARLRQWMVAHSSSNVGRVVLLLLFPLSFIVQVILLRLLSGLAAIQGIQLVPMERVAGWQTIAGIWLVSAVLLGIWPFVAAFWERLFCSSRQEVRVDPVPYWISAGVLVMLVFLV
jgi:hypothetical protein